MLFVARCGLCVFVVVGSLLCVGVGCLLLHRCCSLFVVCCLLFVDFVCGLLVVVRCLWFAVCRCSLWLFVVRCLV